MTSRIDPIRRSDLLRKAARPDPAPEDESSGAEVVRLPVPVSRVERVQPRSERNGGDAAFAAQLLGQDGAKRGLRAGAELIPAAKSLYNRIEWSGARDRRAAKGANAKTKV
jgi:hypothetical protein